MTGVGLKDLSLKRDYWNKLLFKLENYGNLDDVEIKSVLWY